jgi:hypothetical protein
MQDNFIGYLLHALDPETEREVDSYLRAHPEANEQLDLLRQALAPLEADDEEFEPPADLRIRTLARVADHRTHELLSFTLPASPTRPSVQPRSWWRRSDALIAASILIFATSLMLPWLQSLRTEHMIVACQNNLRGFHQALMAYGDDHLGALPKLEELPPHNYAGIVIPTLRQGGYLTDAVSVNCPANGFQPASTVSVETLDNEMLRDPYQYTRDISRLGGCYAYSLGYRENDEYHGIRRAQGYDLLPIMADKPPFTTLHWAAGTLSGNSANHGGIGQNVLFLNGSVHFYKSRNVGIDGDDIYLNREGMPRAGVCPTDTVLGGSESIP